LLVGTRMNPEYFEDIVIKLDWAQIHRFNESIATLNGEPPGPDLTLRCSII
jgi:hypothetical protein